MRRWAAFVVTALIILALPTPVYSDPDADRQRNAARLAEAGSILEGATDRARAAAQSYAEATAALPNATAAVSRAKGVAAAAAATAEVARRDASRARTAYEAATATYDNAVRQVTSARSQTAQFVRAAYQGSALMEVQSLLASGHPADLADRLSYLDQVSRRNSSALAELTEARLRAKVSQNETATARENADAAESAATAALESAERAEREAIDAAAAAERLAESQREALAVASSEKEASLASYAQIQAESGQIAALLQGTSPDLVPSAYHGGYFPMPAHNVWKSSDFGQRYDPYYNVWQLHAGVDLAGNGGSPIYAVADGRVLQAGWNGGYGNYTCINHGSYRGRSIATCYAHQSFIAVSTSQWVRAGQFIGRIGTTGASTGNHLHFEVRLNGEPVQPLDFLPPCLC
jgi:murein DD-endopeptidase MepM/ murein hydrolase activator NlpD